MSPVARPLPLLTAVVALVTLELLRLGGTVLGGAGTLAVAAVPALACLAGPLTWWLGSRQGLTVAVGVLAGARLLVQFPVGRSAPLVGFALAVAVLALVLVVRRDMGDTAAGPGRAARAIALAVAADLALRLPLDLLDLIWRGGVLGWLLVLALVALLGRLATAAQAERLARPAGGAQLAVLGPVFALYTMVFATPGAVAAAGDLPLTVAGLWLAAGAVAGLALLSLPEPARLAGLTRWALPGALPLATVLTALGPAPLVAPAALLGLAVLPTVLRRALAVPMGFGHGPQFDLALAGLGTGLGCVLLALAHEHRVLPWLAALLLALALAGPAAWAATPPPLARAFTPVVVAVLLLAWPPLAGALRAGPEPLPTDTAGGMYRLLTWNVHSAVNQNGQLAPDALHAVIRDSGAQVVVLQEVPRGQPLAGGLDLVTFLERRLDVTAVWAPAADDRFGNLILTSLPVVAAETGELPRAGGDMDRSYAAVTVRLTDGETARIVGTHLHGGAAPGPRLAQLEPVLEQVVGDPTAVLAGDLNARPDTAEIETIRATGLHSAQDEAGDPGLDTAVAPPRRVDWIFGAPEVAFGDFELIDTNASDHLPLAVTVFLE
ncbi:endonuclease/exonuclease/phosphatase family protein [Streptomyces sp. DSM 44915]|uniref:Endonuclease/exonuclease/phosphatase family protein n=1 Tax=Streptomyces chisholmiae TaxID=3075540 RepID=A0ABU2JU04_9ACTN|nr:endonuclease/exonuclease/phosphatase family protein [Streptomyces sp. DSM 44915]MDT0268224.1 endonuclease/exonuclease/phosphatase family protein [Streptomyces sp. DSM 44915]